MPENQILPQLNRYWFNLLPKDKYIEFVKNRFTSGYYELKSNGSKFGSLEEEQTLREELKRIDEDNNLIEVK